MLFVTAFILAASIDPQVFLAVGLGQGTIATPMGYPDTPFASHGVNTREAFLDLRARNGFMTVGVQSVEHPFIGTTLGGQFRFSPLTIGPFRAGLGAQGMRLPRFDYDISTPAYVRITAWHDREWISGVADAGIGGYHEAHIHAVYRYGAVRTPTEITVLMFDQPTVLEHEGFGQSPTKVQSVGAEFRFVPISEVALSGSLTRFWSADGSARVPPQWTVLSGNASIRIPWHLGAMLSGTHATDPLGIVFPNNSLRLLVGVTF